MPYINADTLKYPLSEQDIRLTHPNTSFPEQFVPGAPYAWVFPTPTPAHDPIVQRARELAPELVNGKWMQRWAVESRFVQFEDGDGQVHTVAQQEAEARAADQAARAQALQQQVVAATQARLDAFARTRNYDGILSACTYATSTVPRFAAEGQYAVTARDATWAKLYEILGAVLAGARPMPEGFAAIEHELPALSWPAA